MRSFIMRSDLEDLINRVAYGVYRRYRRWVEAEDIRQEMWAWAYQQDDVRLAEASVTKLRWQLRDVGTLYARREKATRSGYHPDDEAYYALRVIRELLPHAVTTTPVTFRGSADPDEGGVRANGPGPGMEWETAIADLRGAYRGLDPTSRATLAAYVDGGTDVDDADVSKALRAMQRRLGGRRPVRSEA